MSIGPKWDGLEADFSPVLLDKTQYLTDTLTLAP